MFYKFIQSSFPTPFRPLVLNNMITTTFPRLTALAGLACILLLSTADAAITLSPIKNADGTHGFVVVSEGKPALAGTAPLRALLWDGRPAAEPAALQGGYTTLQDAGTEWQGVGELRTQSGAVLKFTDKWTVANDTLCLNREVSVVGGAPGAGFNSVAALRVVGAQSWTELEWFVPGTIYGNSGNLRDNSFGSANYYKKGDYTVWMREDRLSAPLLAARLPDGASVAVLSSAPDGATNAADGLTFSYKQLASGDFRFGSILAEETPDAIAIGYAYPGTEGTLTYGPKSYAHKVTSVQRWRYRYSPLEDGFTQRYEITFRLSSARDTNDLVSSSWRWAWQTLKPQVNPQPLEILRRNMVDVLKENYVQKSNRSGIRFVAAAEANPKPPSSNETKIILGFLGYSIGAAEMMLVESERDPAAPRSKELRKAAEKIIATFLRLPVDPPIAEGFILSSGKYAASQTPIAKPLTEDSPIFLRSFCDDMKSLMRAYEREQRAGRQHPEWLAWVRKFGDWLLLTQEQPGGGFPRSWHALTGDLLDGSTTGTFNAVPFYAQLYRLTQHKPYLDAALRSGEIAWNSGHNRARFIGGTIDNPNVIDKEAATISFEGYLSLHTATGDKKWLDRARAAADIAETWIYIWNVPMPSDATQDELHWPIGQSTVGMQLIATGHSGTDAYMAWDVESYARLSRETGDPHYMDVARILLHNTKATTGRPGDNRLTRGPGWQQEHCWLSLPRGKGRHRAWLPWVTVSHLRGINDLIDYDPELYKQLAAPAP